MSFTSRPGFFPSVATSARTRNTGRSWTGIIANPKFEETLKVGSAHVREVRRKWKLGVNIPAATKEG
jgi:hypothetical protein